MNKREIITLMHRLFYGDIDTSDGYRHLMKNNDLDKDLINELLAAYIKSENVLIYLDSQNALECKLSESYNHIKQYLKQGRVRIADPKFTGRVLIEPTGVGVGALTSQSKGTPKSGAPY